MRLLALIPALFFAGACRSTKTPIPAPSLSPPPDSVTLRRRSHVQQLIEQLGNNANRPAGEAFRNVQSSVLKSFPATRLLAMMDQGYGRSLGVSCEHCHIIGRWESDSIPAKRIARGMQEMVFSINSGLLGKTGVRQGAVVNCTTCHRGAVRPVSNLDQRPGAR